ncbi:MAG: peptidylprolyl isomerase, partial [Phycisphaerae bacterium]|nr:peptidylprolyl isomerase [Phycisphaerae bacterium]
MARFFGFRLAAPGLFLCIALIFSLSAASADTIAHFDTSLGSFDVQLYDTSAPITVQNFLDYVTNTRYQDSFIHRSIPGFIIQGGGFTYDQPQVEATDFPAVPAFDPIVNEFDPSRSNIRGTIAMAKVGAQYDDQGNLIPGTGPDSATSQWFFNLGDNSSNLDNQNGGFTVFGEVLGNGMDVVDAIAAVDIFNFTTSTSAVFSNLPLRNYTWDDWNTYVPVTDDNVVLVNVSVPEPTTLGLLA